MATCLAAAGGEAALLPGAPGVLQTINGTGGSDGGVLLTYHIPITNWPGTITLSARGADGGHASAGPLDDTESYLGEGGGGATATATFAIDLTATNALRPGGEVRFIVGNRGQSFVGHGDGDYGAGGGGGGSGILYRSPLPAAAWELLLLGGGGGGGYVDSFVVTPEEPLAGRNASTTRPGTGDSLGGNYRGTEGGGGAAWETVVDSVSYPVSGGGGGYLGAGVYALSGRQGGSTGGAGGGALADNYLRRGGWGCGGGGASGLGSPAYVDAGGGGGGGYSGGDGGAPAKDANAGGGGGSYVSDKGSSPGVTASGGSGRIHGRVAYTFGNLTSGLLPPPVITLNGAALVEVPLFGTYSELGATARDAYGTVIATQANGIINTSVLGDQTVTYSATDAFGRTTTAIRTVRITQLSLRRLYVHPDANGANIGTSWFHAFRLLQDALSAVQQPAAYEIWVAEGTYRPDYGGGKVPGDKVASFKLISNVTLYGGFSGNETSLAERDPVLHPTILTGDLNGTGQADGGDSLHVVRAEGVNGLAGLDGFTITSGYAETGVAGDGLDRSGAGMVLTGGAAPLVENCVFKGNRAGTYGGGVAILDNCPGARFVRCRFERNSCGWGGSAFSAAAPFLAGGPLATNPCQVIDSVFVGNTQHYFGGAGSAISVVGHAADFFNVLVTGNTSLSGAGVRVDSIGDIAVRFFNSTVAGNRGGSAFGGIRVAGSCHLTLENSIVWGNASGSASRLNDSLQFFSLDVPVNINHSLIQHYTPSLLGGTGNLDGTAAANDPQFRGPVAASAAPTVAGDYRLSVGSPLVNAGDNGANPRAQYSNSVDLVGNPRISGAIIDLGPYEIQAPFFVDRAAAGQNTGRTWLDAFTNLNDALAGVRDGGEIHIAAGTYHPGTTPSATFRIQAGARLYGGYPHGGGSFEGRNPELFRTVLSGDIGTPGVWTDNSASVVTVDNGSSGVTQVELDGIEVRDGYGPVAGGGVLCRENLTLRRCRIEHNHAGDSGGGVTIQGPVTLTATDSIFRDNEAASGSGGALHGFDGARLWIGTSLFESNRAATSLGGAVSLAGGAGTLVNCRLAGNQAWRGGAVFNSGGSLQLINVLVSGNRASGEGGGLYVDADATTALLNVTLSGNDAAGSGGALANLGALAATNSLIWNNRANASVADPAASLWNNGGTIAFSHSLVQGLDLAPAGPGNLNGNLPVNDPLFVTPVAPSSAPSTVGDLRLQANSPALHAGDSAAVTEGSDLDGRARILGPAVDLGSYERAGVVYVDASATGGQTGSSWADAYPTVQAALAFVAGPGAGAFNEIWIAEGTYVPNAYDFSGGPQGFLLPTSLNLRGGFPAGGSALGDRDPAAHPTILDATGTSGRVLTINDGNDAVAQSVLLDGLVVRGGLTPEDGVSPVGEARGGGIYSRENLTLRQVVVTGNQAEFLGGGLCLDRGTAVIEGSTIRDNTANGRSISPAIGHAGGGLYAAAGVVVTLVDSKVLSNQSLYSNARGAGLCLLAGSRLQAVRCHFAGNHGIDHGGALYASGAMVAFESCAFTGNVGRNGGAVYQDQMASGSYTNCTFAGNAASLTPVGRGDGGALGIVGATAYLVSSLVWGNQSAEAPDTATASILVSGGGSVSYQHSLVQHLDLVGAGAGNLDGTLPGNDPLLAAPLAPTAAPSEAGDFRLHLGSPCVDAGAATSPASATDLLGNYRLQGTAVDLGAYEGAVLTRSNVHVFQGGLDTDFLKPGNWLSAGTPTPATMAAGDIYVVLAEAQLDGPAMLGGALRVAAGSVLTVASNGSMAFPAGADLLVAGTLVGNNTFLVPAPASFALAGGTLAGEVTSLAPLRVSSACTVAGSLTLPPTTVSGSGTLTVNGLLRTSGPGISTVNCSLVLSNTNGPARVLEVSAGSSLQNGAGLDFAAGTAVIFGTWNPAQSPLVVAAAATLAGTGTVGVAVDVFGRIEPGPETGYGDLRINGNFTHRPEATTILRVGGSAAGQFNRIQISGLAALGGTLLVNFTERPLAGAGTYVFIEANSGTMFSYLTRTPIGLAPSRTFGYNNTTPGQFTITSAGTPYGDWAFAQGLESGVNDGFQEDPNHDGIANILHFASDSDPLNGSGDEGKRRLSFVNISGTNHFALTMPVRLGAVFTGTPSLQAQVDGIIYTLRGGVDLQGWTLPVLEFTPALADGLPPLRDVDGDGNPDWEYRTFILGEPVGTKGFLSPMVSPVP